MFPQHTVLHDMYKCACIQEQLTEAGAPLIAPHQVLNSGVSLHSSTHTHTYTCQCWLQVNQCWQEHVIIRILRWLGEHHQMHRTMFAWTVPFRWLGAHQCYLQVKVIYDLAIQVIYDGPLMAHSFQCIIKMILSLSLHVTWNVCVVYIPLVDVHARVLHRIQPISATAVVLIVQKWPTMYMKHTIGA